MISISAEHNAVRLQATKGFIDTGTGVAALLLYDVARVADDVDAGSPLATITLPYPCGEVTSTGLELAPSADGFVHRTGDVLWGRIINRDGDVVLSADVRTETDPPEDGEIVVAQRTHFAGGSATLVSGVLG